MKLVILQLSQKLQRPEFVERDLIKQANKTLGKFAVEHSSYYPCRSAAGVVSCTMTTSNTRLNNCENKRGLIVELILKQ